MGRAWGALCAKYLEISNLNQKKLKKGVYSSDHSSGHRMAVSMEAADLELVPVKVPVSVVVLEIVLGPV